MKNCKIHIWPDDVRISDGQTLFSATIELPGKKKESLWYSVPSHHIQTQPVNSDHFLVALIYKLMETGLDAHIHGEISETLLRNLDEYMSAWGEWLENLVPVNISADSVRDRSIDSDRADAIVAFSGGVDSCFTAYRHAKKEGPLVPFNPIAGIMVHGFDIPLEEPEMFSAAVERSKKMLETLNMSVIPVATNFRSLVSDWSHTFGAAVASCLMLFSGDFRNGLIGQGFTYSEIAYIHEGSNPITDALLSNHLFKIVPDGTSYTRADKINAMRSWDEFLKYLRVCWQGPEKDKNCCECEKCIRNILTFKALGLSKPPCFAKDVTTQQLKSFKMGIDALPEIRYGRLPEIARVNDVNGEWIQIIEERIMQMRLQKNRNYLYSLSRFAYYQLRIWEKMTGKPMKVTLDTKSSEGLK